MNGVEGGKTDVEGAAVEIDVGVAVPPVAVAVDAEREAVPGFGVEGPVEEGLAGKKPSVEGDRKGKVQRGRGQRGFDAVDVVLGVEEDRGAVRKGRVRVGQHVGGGLAEEAVRIQGGAPAGSDRRGRGGTGGDRAREGGERVEPHSCRVLGGGGVGGPGAFAE